MKKLILFGIICFLLLSFSVTAWHSSVLHAYVFNDSTATSFADDAGSLTLINMGSPKISALYPTFTTSGSGTNQSLGLDDTGGFKDNGVVDMTQFSNPSGNAIAFWMNKTAAGLNNNDALFQFKDTPTNKQFYTILEAGIWNAYVYDGGSFLCNSINWFNETSDSKWHSYVLNFDGVYWVAWRDGSVVGNITCGYTMSYTGSSTEDLWFFYLNGGGYIPADVDQYLLINKTLSLAEINNFHNYGTIIGIPPPGSNINVSNPKPFNNTQFNTVLLNINTTVNATTDFSCSLYINSSLNQTSSYSSGNDVSVSFNVSFLNTTESDFTYYLYCNTSTNNDTTPTNTFFIDNVQPNLYWYFPFSGAVLNYFNSPVFTTNITVVDSNLYSYYYNISYNNGTTLYNFSNISLTGISIYNITNVINMSGYFGLFNASVKVCDGHTDEELKKKTTVKKYKDKFQFLDGAENVNIQITDNSYSTNYIQLQDRYKFKFNTKDAKDTQTFIVSSDKYINILNGKTKYAGHLVTGDRWIDFERADIKSVHVTRISDKVVSVTVKLNSATTNWEFNSIGELNCRTETNPFYVYNISEHYTPKLLTTAQTTFYLNITHYSSTYITSFLATLNYNNTEYSATGYINNGNNYAAYVTLTTPLISSNTNFSFYWNYSVNSQQYNTTNHTQELYIPILSTNCSLYPTIALNFTLLDEDTNLPITGYMSWIMTYFSNAYSNSISGNINGTSSQAFCIYPAFGSFNANISLEYMNSPSSFTSRTYESNSHVIDNSTEIIPLLLLLNPTDVTFHVIDDANNDLLGVQVMAYRYYPSSGNYTKVGTEYTDNSGNVIFGLKQGAAQYRFEFYQDGILKLNTTTFKIFSTEYTIILERDIIVNTSQDFDGINILIDPSVFNNGTTTTLFFQIFSTDGLLTGYGYNVTYPSGTASASGTINIGQVLSSNLTINSDSVFDTVRIDYYYVTNLSGRRNFTKYISINFVGNNTFMANKDQTYGLGIFERLLITTGTSITVIGIAALIGQVVAGLALVLFLMGYFVFIGFIPLWSVLITMLVGVLILIWKSGG